MSVHSMKPTFYDKAGYMAWRSEWRVVYTTLSTKIRDLKSQVKRLQRENSNEASALQRELAINRAIANKMMTLLGEAKLRRDRIIGMQQSLKEQFDSFPLTLGKNRNVDFHFNKGSLEFPFLPMWMLKAGGKTFYVNHIDAQCPWSTRELPEGSTRGMIRFKRCNIEIDKEGTALITEA